jgi:hypothetical protein
MSKRGRPLIPSERRRSVRVSVSVREDVADTLFVYAQHKREPLSAILNRLLERLAARERELTAYQKAGSGWPIAR